MVIMLLKVGINKKGINGDVDSYIFNQKFSFSDIEKMKRKVQEYIQAIPVEYTEIELYQYCDKIKFKKYTINLKD